ncbi:phage tail assembly protein [Ciceribacter ferrooxidans]|uniref:Phage tail assembly protein n=1 Tax=Ciceribacter ferrooxidans TaxID=2509717 RepID=A0A4Q2SXK7_9HYPH|nr:phage tail assembly protein [Ciceribacter ferrooxidans]RYC10181.1 phage tail assembly protein [Ciceribacter ferrooxidans]
MAPRKRDDPLGEALAGGSAGRDAADDETGEAPALKPVMVDLDQFTTSPAEAAAFRAAAAPSAIAEEDGPNVSYTQEAGTRIYTLLHPPTVNGVLLRQVEMRQPEQGDIDDFFSGELSGNRAMICRLTSLHPAVFRRLKWPDAEAIHQLYRDIVPGFIAGEE